MGRAGAGGGRARHGRLRLADDGKQPELKTGVVEQPSSKGADAHGHASARSYAKAQGQDRGCQEPGQVGAAARQPPASPVARQDESTCADVDKCVSILKAMVADPNRPDPAAAAPAVLANGARLFAYRVLRPKLTCSEPPRR
jgi:hypothetical protein